MHTTRISLDAAIDRIAGRHHGAIARWQLRDAGIDRHAESRRIASGALRPYVADTNLWHHGDAPPSRRAHLAACVLAGGPGAVLGGEAAATLAGTWNRPSGRVDVFGPVHRPAPTTADLRLHRVAEPPGADRVRYVDRIPTVGTTWTLLQLGTHLDRWQIPYVCSEAEAAGLLDRDDVERELRAWRGRRGVREVRAGWANYIAHSIGTRNATEDRCLGLLHQVGHDPLVNVRGATGIAGVIPDFTVPEQGRIIEVWGERTHRMPGAAEADRARDAAHRAAGWETMWVNWRRVWYDAERLAEDLATFLG